jgi:hypothetical protein
MSSFVAGVAPDIGAIKRQLQQLEQLHQSGGVTDSVYAEARTSLERRILDWVLRDEVQTSAHPTTPDAAVLPPNIDRETRATQAPSKGILIGWAFLAVLVIGAYLWRDHPTKMSDIPVSSSTVVHPALAVASANQAPHSSNLDQISEMTDKLAARLKTQPDDAPGWAMLARSYGVLGNHTEALKAYEHALNLVPKDAVLLADYAQEVAAASKLGLAAGGGLSGMSLVVESPRAPTSDKTLSGTVTLAPALANSVKPGDTLFVVARPQEGSRMPLAMLQKKVSDLPLQFALDDSMGMSPVVRLSTAGKVVVSVRISKTASPSPERGDLGSQSAPVSVGAKGLLIEISGPIKP